MASHARAQRLGWLLDALAEQTLDRTRWEVVVVHDNPASDPTEALLLAHALTTDGTLRHHQLPVGTGSPARQRNVGWRDSGARWIAFTDDDCRPQPDWLERMLAAAEAAPEAIVQGATTPDPREADRLREPRVRTLRVEPPAWSCPTCNVLYPRVALEQVDGFDERFPGPAGEDTDLAARVRAATGAALVAVPEAEVFHAVEAYSWSGWVRLLWKWQHLPAVVGRHPQLRKRLPLRVFWKPSHWKLLLAVVGLAGARSVRPLALLALPYLAETMLEHGRSPRGVGRAATELPTRVTTDVVELLALARGSVRYRTLLL